MMISQNQDLQAQCANLMRRCHELELQCRSLQQWESSYERMRGESSMPSLAPVGQEGSTNIWEPRAGIDWDGAEEAFKDLSLETSDINREES